MGPFPETRYRLLDPFRGLAALSVALFHAYSPWLDANPGLLAAPVAALVRHGWLGVELFFVISGYCIAALMLRCEREGRSAAVFLVDRLCRIMPPYWATLALLLAIRLAAQPFNQAPFSGDLIAWSSSLFLAEPWADRPRVLIVAWSLAYELGFYLLMALCWLHARRVGFAAIGLAAGVALAGYGILARDPAAPLEYWPHFLLGLAAWALIHRCPSHRRTLALVGTGAGLAAAGLLDPARQLPWIVAVAFAALLVLMHPADQVLSRARVLRPLAFLGSISYSLYLVHVPIVSPLGNLSQRAWPADSAPAAVLPLLITFAAIGVAWAFHRLVERPSERLRRTLFPGRPAAT
jgi:peptidoglycan/LPS O-acetylase OafA/YrhL